MKNSRYIADYVYLAEASYANFSNKDITNEEAIQKVYPDNPKPESFAKLVTDHYTVEAHWEDKAGNGRDSLLSSESGFSGTLFKGTGKDGGNDGYVLALKGTAGEKDLLQVDGGEIVAKGLAYNQIADMYNFWNQIKAEYGKTYKAAKVETVAVEFKLTDKIVAEIDEFLTQNPNPDNIELSDKVKAAITLFLSDFKNDNGYLITDSQKLSISNDIKQLSNVLVNKVLAWHTTPALQNLRSLSYHIKTEFIDIHQTDYISISDSASIYNDERQYGLGINDINKVTVTGHSLGGHLSAAFSRLFSDDTEHAYMVNGAGFNEASKS